MRDSVCYMLIAISQRKTHWFCVWRGRVKETSWSIAKPSEGKIHAGWQRRVMLASASATAAVNDELVITDHHCLVSFQDVIKCLQAADCHWREKVKVRLAEATVKTSSWFTRALNDQQPQKHSKRRRQWKTTAINSPVAALFSLTRPKKDSVGFLWCFS